MDINFVNINSLAAKEGDFLIRNVEIPKPDFQEISANFRDFIQLSEHYQYAVFGEDFNILFLLNSSKKTKYRISMALTGDSVHTNAIDRIYQLLLNLYMDYEKIQIYINQEGVYVNNIVINDKACLLHIKKYVYKTPEQVCASMAFASQEMCFFNGKLYMSRQCKAALETGVIVVNFDRYRYLFEDIMYGEFCKGFSFSIPHFINDNKQAANCDAIEFIIRNFPENQLQMSPMNQIICLPNLMFIPVKMQPTVADCSTCSWTKFKTRVWQDFMRSNTRALARGDLEHVYIMINPQHGEWHYLVSCEIIHSKMEEIEAYLSAFFEHDEIVETVNRMKKNCQYIESNLAKYTKLTCEMYEETAAPPDSAEKWCGEYYAFRL